MRPDYVDAFLREVETGYNCIMEQPWAKFPKNITIKDVTTKKWFAAILVTGGDKVGLPTTEEVWLCNVKADPDSIPFLVGSEDILPAYHMNKEHWVSVLLHENMDMERVMHLVETSFHLVTDSPTKRIYEAVKKIPKGKVATYKQVAEMAGNPKMSRAVGNALHKNPDEEHIPCYRVVSSDGVLADEFIFGGADVQKERLEADGIEVIDHKVDLEKYGMKL